MKNWQGSDANDSATCTPCTGTRRELKHDLPLTVDAVLEQLAAGELLDVTVDSQVRSTVHLEAYCDMNDQ